VTTGRFASIVTRSQCDARRLVGPGHETARCVTHTLTDGPTSTGAGHPVAHVPTPADCLDDGVLAIDGCGSLFLFDLVHARFQRLPRGSDAARAARYGSWLPLRELVLDADGTFTVEPGEGGGPRVRSHAHGVGCWCAATEIS
jgi:hypothetical protein